MPHRTTMLLILGTVLAAGGSCATRQDFTPATNVSAISPEGYAAAAYDLDVPEGTFAQTRVWSDGAIERDFEGAERTFVHVGFDIENQTSETLNFDTDELYLDSATIDGRALEDVPVSQVVGPTQLAPGEAHRIDAWFVLPPDADPWDVDAFQVHWSLYDSTHTYARRTPFVELPAVDRYGYYYSPYYDPFYTGPYYGWGYRGYYGPGLVPSRTLPPPAVVHPYPYRQREDVGTQGEPTRQTLAPRRRQEPE